MNTVLKVGAASALTLAGVAAHASIASPSTGSSDAILFAEVQNSAGTAAIASYAGDTGVSITALAAGGVAKTVLGSDSNLAKLFAADNTAAGDTIVWAVLGGQYAGNNATSSPYTAAGMQFLTTTLTDSTKNLAKITNSGLSAWAQGINTDLGTVNSNSGGAASVEGSNPATSGVWDVNNTTGTAYWYGAQANGNALGSTHTLFYVASSTGGNTTKGTFSGVETVSLSANGLAFAGTGTPPPPVPLPAAVWLLGSGLLGLAGVARRKSKA